MPIEEEEQPDSMQEGESRVEEDQGTASSPDALPPPGKAGNPHLPPNETLYLSNLNDKIKKQGMRVGARGWGVGGKQWKCC